MHEIFHQTPIASRTFIAKFSNPRTTQSMLTTDPETFSRFKHDRELILHWIDFYKECLSLLMIKTEACPTLLAQNLRQIIWAPLLKEGKSRELQFHIQHTNFFILGTTIHLIKIVEVVQNLWNSVFLTLRMWKI
jgi:hypothetical protein